MCTETESTHINKCKLELSDTKMECTRRSYAKAELTAPTGLAWLRSLSSPLPPPHLTRPRRPFATPTVAASKMQNLLQKTTAQRVLRLCQRGGKGWSEREVCVDIVAVAVVVAE